MFALGCKADIINLQKLKYAPRGLPRVKPLSDLYVEVLDNGLRVTQFGTPFVVTYVRNQGSQMLESHELLGIPEIDGQEASFLAAAWRAAYSKAKELAWT